jgi:hypothetical protein
LAALKGTLTFVETSAFSGNWQRLNLTDDDLSALQNAIMARPKNAPAVQGTGGLRKIRFAAQGGGRGKRGGHRACYVYFEDHGLVLLVVVYAKNERDDISPTQRKTIRRLIASTKEALARRTSLG